jgi:hypothetical protein
MRNIRYCYLDISVDLGGNDLRENLAWASLVYEWEGNVSVLCCLTNVYEFVPLLQSEDLGWEVTY